MTKISYQSILKLCKPVLLWVSWPMPSVLVLQTELGSWSLPVGISLSLKYFFLDSLRFEYFMSVCNSACLCGIFHNDPLCVRYFIIFRMFVFLHGLFVCCSNKIHSANTSTEFLQVTWRSGDVHDWTSVIRRTVFCLCHPLHLNNALVCS